MDITVIIPTYNRAKLLRRTLQGFCEQMKSEWQWEIIVVSDGSVDSSHQTVLDFMHLLPVRYFYQPKLGVASARNLGLYETHAHIVLFLDDDVIPSPGLIAEHGRFHKEHLASESALLGYVTWAPNVRVTPFMQWYGEFGGLFGFSRLNDNQIADPRYLYSCNISFKRNFLSANGGFNESLSVLEDHELGYRLTKRGLKLHFRRAALGYHNQCFTFDQACGRLERYSDGLPAFCATEAGRAMVKRRARFLFRAAETFAKVAVPILSVLRPFIDSEIRLPNAVYRLFYWYYATYRAFWSRYPTIS